MSHEAPATTADPAALKGILAARTLRRDVGARLGSSRLRSPVVTAVSTARLSSPKSVSRPNFVDQARYLFPNRTVRILYPRGTGVSGRCPPATGFGVHSCDGAFAGLSLLRAVVPDSSASEALILLPGFSSANACPAGLAERRFRWLSRAAFAFGSTLEIASGTPAQLCQGRNGRRERLGSQIGGTP